MKDANSPKHFYMVSGLMTFVRGGNIRQRHMNLVMELKNKIIPMSAIDEARQGFLQRLHMEAPEPIDEVKDVVFLGFNYLGVMAPSTFYDMGDPNTQSNPSSH